MSVTLSAPTGTAPDGVTAPRGPDPRDDLARLAGQPAHLTTTYVARRRPSLLAVIGLVMVLSSSSVEERTGRPASSAPSVFARQARFAASASR